MTRVLFLSALVLSMAMAASTAFARGLHPNAPGGGDVPTPFNALNQKVELAHGERYVLMGRVVFYNGSPYLAVDLEAHPWLASAKRVDAPYYRLDSSPYYWRRFDGAQVKLIGEAHGEVRQVNGRFAYDLSLAPLADPEVMAPRSARRR